MLMLMLMLMLILDGRLPACPLPLPSVMRVFTLPNFSVFPYNGDMGPPWRLQPASFALQTPHQMDSLCRAFLGRVTSAKGDR